MFSSLGRKLCDYSRGRLISLLALSVMFTVVGLGSGTASARFYGVFYVGGPIEDTYNSLGGPRMLGLPVTQELSAGRGGRYQLFMWNNNSIYWHPQADRGQAHLVNGAIKNKWVSLKSENGELGYPTSNPTAIRSGGIAQHFERGSIYFAPGPGAHAVSGAIRNVWFRSGAERGKYGFPTNDAYRAQEGSKAGMAQNFQGGRIFIPFGR